MKLGLEVSRPLGPPKKWHLQDPHIKTWKRPIELDFAA